MSLHKFAEQVAANGRGDDSLLVHMTPDEVRNLQKFAEANGTTLTINPETGLPEAGLLSDLFKAVAPIALGAFLGPAGLAFGGPGLSAAMAGVATGGITALATGSLSRGLMAGLGAYGGAGIGESFMKAGTGALSQAAGAGLEQTAAEQAIGAKLASATPMETLTAGFNSATANPAAMGTFAKQNLSNIGMAAAPLMAMQPTTQMPETKGTGYIRQFDYNINPDTGKPDPLYGMRAMTPVKASEFGDKTFQGQRELFRQQNPNPYELGVGSLNQPPQQSPRMNTGGIVALADGGVPGYADGALVNDQQIFDYFKGLDQAAINSGALDAKIAADMQTYNVSAADIARATGTQANQGDFEKRFVNAVNTPGTSAQEFQAMTSDVGLKDQALANALSGSGMSAAAQYAATHGLSDASGIANAPKSAQDFYNTFGYTAGALPGDQGGLEGLYANINYSAKGLQDQINAGKLTVDQAQRLADAEMARVGVSQKDVKAATGKDLFSLFTPKGVVLPTPFTSVVPGGTQLPGATVYDNGAFGNYGSGPATGVDYRGNTVSIATPGDIITNPDQTRTVVPNIPGRPYGGFTGAEQLKSRYTAGGGSLGYTAKAPRTIDEFNQLYNKQTGDSLAAYDYLMGKGGGKYPVKSGVPQISQNYGEYVLGKKPVEPKAKPKTTEKTVGAGDTAVVGGVSFDLTDPTKQPAEDNNGTWQWEASLKRWVQIGKAASGGLQGYAMGGGLGSLGSYSDGGRLLKGPGDGVSDSIPATIGAKNQPARLADGEFVVPARIVSELGNGSTEAGAKKLYAMMDRVQKARGKTTGKNKVAANSRADKYLPA